MTIGEVNDYLTNNANGKAYLADELTKEGYGQTKGGYRDKAVKEPKRAVLFRPVGGKSNPN